MTAPGVTQRSSGAEVGRWHVAHFHLAELPSIARSPPVTAFATKTRTSGPARAAQRRCAGFGAELYGAWGLKITGTSARTQDHQMTVREFSPERERQSLGAGWQITQTMREAR